MDEEHPQEPKDGAQDNELPLNDEHTPQPVPKHEYLPPDYHQDKGRAKRVFLYSLVTILILGAAAAAYWFGFHKKTPAKSANQQTNSSTQQSSTQPASQIDSTTKHYDSANFSLGIDYPANWTLTDNGGGKMTIVSPALQLKGATGQTVSGKITLLITPKGQNLSDFSAGSAIAVMDSEKIAYTQPTQTQRANTYLSFLRFATDADTNAMDGIYITGDAGYQKGQYIPKTDVAKIDPEVAMTFTDASGKPLSIAASNWNDTTFSGPITKIFTSLVVN